MEEQRKTPGLPLQNFPLIFHSETSRDFYSQTLQVTQITLDRQGHSYSACAFPLTLASSYSLPDTLPAAAPETSLDTRFHSCSKALGCFNCLHNFVWQWPWFPGLWPPCFKGEPLPTHTFCLLANKLTYTCGASIIILRTNKWQKRCNIFGASHQLV